MEAKRLNGLIGNIAAAVRRELKVAEAAPEEPRYRRTFSDDYPWLTNPRAREPVPEEQRAHWEEMARKGKW